MASRVLISALPLARIARCGAAGAAAPKRLSLRVTATRSFGWGDTLRIAETVDDDDDPSDLGGYYNKVRICNRGSEKRLEFLPFVIDDQIAGYVHKGFADHLRKYTDVFTFHMNSSSNSHSDGCMTLHPLLRTPQDRTEAVGGVIRCLGGLIPGIRNELYPVISSFGMPIFFSLERAAAPYFGIKAYGVHMNGYVDRNGEKFLWIGKRSDSKPTYPGMLDHLVAGGLPHGITCYDNLLEECEEEAGIPSSISHTATQLEQFRIWTLMDTGTREMFCFAMI